MHNILWNVLLPEKILYQNREWGMENVNMEFKKLEASSGLLMKLKLKLIFKLFS